jgi:hypothetical protein
MQTSSRSCLMVTIIFLLKLWQTKSNGFGWDPTSGQKPSTVKAKCWAALDTDLVTRTFNGTVYFNWVLPSGLVQNAMVQFV